jgi:hypothetical protein
MHPIFNLLQRSLDNCRFLPIFSMKLSKSQFVHLLLYQHQNLIDLLNQIHLLYHLTLLHLLQVHLLLYLTDLALLVYLDFVQTVYLLCLSTLLTVEMQ